MDQLTSFRLRPYKEHIEQGYQGVVVKVMSAQSPSKHTAEKSPTTGALPNQSPRWPTNGLPYHWRPAVVLGSGSVGEEEESSQLESLLFVKLSESCCELRRMAEGILEDLVHWGSK